MSVVVGIVETSRRWIPTLIQRGLVCYYDVDPLGVVNGIPVVVSVVVANAAFSNF